MKPVSDKALRPQEDKLAWQSFIWPLASPPRRLLVLGLPGSGKSTFAHALAERFGVTHIDADDLWNGNTRELRDRVSRATSKSPWVYEGHFSKTSDILLPRLTEVVWLDVSFPKLFLRLLRRERQRCGWRGMLLDSNSHFRFATKNWYSLQRTQLKALQWIIHQGIPVIRLK